MPLEAGGPLLGFEASWKEREVKVSPKAAGSIYYSECQAGECKGFLPQQRGLISYLCRNEKKLETFLVFPALSDELSGFRISGMFPRNQWQGAGKCCCYSLLHSHFYLTFSFLPFMLL